MNGMKVPLVNKRKNATVDGGFNDNDDSPLDNDPNSNTMEKLFLAPYHNGGSKPSPGTAIATALFVFLGALLNGWVFHACLDGLLKSALIPTAADKMIRAIIIAIVAAGVYYLPQLWSYDTDLPLTVYPEITWTQVGSMHKIGVLVGLVYNAVQFAGFVVAGFILRQMDGAVNAGVLNAPTDPAGKTLYWFGSMVVCVAYVMAVKLRNDGENEEHSTHRGALASALALFLVTIGFIANLNVSYSSGMSVSALIATFSSVDWAFKVFVPLFASSGAAVLLYLVVLVLVRYGSNKRPYSGYKKSDSEMSPAASKISSRVGAVLKAVY